MPPAAMAPAAPSAVARDRQLKPVLGEHPQDEYFRLLVQANPFASQLLNTLPEVQNGDAAELVLAEIATNTRELVETRTRTQAKCSGRVAKDLERQGRDLWNACLRLSRQEDARKTGERPKLFTKVRVLAFCMIAVGRDNFDHEHVNKGVDASYLLDLALKTVRYCAQNDDISSAGTIMQMGSNYLQSFKKTLPDGTPDAMQNRAFKLEVDYLVIRMSWKQSRMEVAECTFVKIQPLLRGLEAASIETLADTLRTIGSDCLIKKDLLMAAKWLKRAQNAISLCEIDDLSMRGLDIRLEICQSLIRTHLRQDTPEGIEEAESLVLGMESQLGDKPIVLHWRLEILQCRPREEVTVQALATILRRMIRVFDGSGEMLDFLLHHIKELGENAVQLACALLDQLMLQSILPSKLHPLIGRVLIRRIWLAVKDEASDNPAETLQSLLRAIHEHLQGPVEPDVAGAAQSV
ncbi:meiosis protein SPO22/ZIP4 like domain-containing protein [Sarocladium implicatum]|nr:meiosis protein SPO22/ZIP4 like domain-containing protein [Sarocladium implicatum]